MRIVAFTISILISSAVFSEEIFLYSKELNRNSLESIIDKIISETPTCPDGEFYEFLIKNNYDQLAVDAVRYLKTRKLPSQYVVMLPWTNPISIAYKYGKVELIKKLAHIDNSLLNLRDGGGQFDGVVPLRNTVDKNDIAITRLLIKLGADVNTPFSVADKESGLGFAKNLLSFVVSAEMEKLLVDNNIRRSFLFQDPFDSYCLDNNVNIRNGPGKNYKVVGTLNKNEKISILENSFHHDEINNIKACWIKIERLGSQGWIWSPYAFIQFGQ